MNAFAYARDVEEHEKKLYFTQHYGNTVNKCDYNGSNIETIVSKPGNVSFQPSDVAVDSIAGRMFVSVEGDEDIRLFGFSLEFGAAAF